LHRCPMILLLPHPLTPLFRRQVVSLSQSLCMSSIELTGGKGGDRVGWGRSQIKRRRESLVLNRSFHTLCSLPFLTLTLPMYCISLTPLLSPSSPHLPPPPPPMDYCTCFLVMSMTGIAKVSSPPLPARVTGTF
jgi:hypothetical protein